jgi:hypothetical protein
MRHYTQISLIVTLLGVFLVSGIAMLGNNQNIQAQNAYNQSVSSSTVCVNDQPCQTIICSQNQPCYLSKPPDSNTVLKSPDPNNTVFSLDEFWDDSDDSLDNVILDPEYD